MNGYERNSAPTITLQHPEGDYRHVDVFSYTKGLLDLTPTSIPTAPIPLIYPRNFEEVYAARVELAKNEVTISRNASVENQYLNLLNSLTDKTKYILDQYFEGVIFPNDKRYAITPNKFPCDLPANISHLVFWYLDEALPTTWISDKISAYILERKLTASDFVCYQRANSQGQLIHGITRSIPLPHAHLLINEGSQDRDSFKAIPA
jgi:hypothetical protein